MGESYDVGVTITQTEKPPRLTLAARIADVAGAQIAQIETMLRLVPRTGLGGAS
jgi:hypothetical protein